MTVEDDVELEAPTLEEGMKIVAWLERHGGVDPEELPEPYRAEYERNERNVKMQRLRRRNHVDHVDVGKANPV